MMETPPGGVGLGGSPHITSGGNMMIGMGMGMGSGPGSTTSSNSTSSNTSNNTFPTSLLPQISSHTRYKKRDEGKEREGGRGDGREGQGEMEIGGTEERERKN